MGCQYLTAALIASCVPGIPDHDNLPELNNNLEGLDTLRQNSFVSHKIQEQRAFRVFSFIQDS